MDIMDWYTGLLGEFRPDTIWREGDNAYSDGTPATDFSDQVYGSPGWNLDPAMRTWTVMHNTFGSSISAHNFRTSPSFGRKSMVERVITSESRDDRCPRLVIAEVLRRPRASGFACCRWMEVRLLIRSWCWTDRQTMASPGGCLTSACSTYTRLVGSS